MKTLSLLVIRLLPLAFALAGCGALQAQTTTARTCTDPSRPHECSSDLAWVQDSMAGIRR